ncbi:MAG: glycosyltransferase family 2 protein [Ruminococcaceae bacterium]|nr:glycosyltransferase family 2 protein [Oscillospiraceae bacterium]
MTQNEILVSVVIPAYNSANTIVDAIRSALKQSVSLEVIVIDDCSTDNICEKISIFESDARFKYVRNRANLGVAKSRNLGVSLAQGEYVAFLDADDYWVDRKLEKQIELIRKTDAVICATARELINPDGTSTGRIIPVDVKISYKDLLKHNSINCSSVLIKTDVAKEFPMHNDDCHEDYIMWLEVLSKYGYACGINEPLLKYRLSNKGKSGSKLKSAKMTFKVYRYMGFGLFKSCVCFLNYAFNGVKKYFFG